MFRKESSTASSLIGSFLKRQASEEEECRRQELLDEQAPKEELERKRRLVLSKNLPFQEMDQRIGASKTLGVIAKRNLRGEAIVTTKFPYGIDAWNQDNLNVDPSQMEMGIQLFWRSRLLEVRINPNTNSVRVLGGLSVEDREQVGGALSSSDKYEKRLSVESRSFAEEFQKALAEAFQNSQLTYPSPKPSPKMD